MAKRKSRPTQGTFFGIPSEPERPTLLREETMFDGHPVRIIYVKGEPRWVLADLARVLGYRDAGNASRLVRDKHKGTQFLSTPGGTQEMLTVNEPGLYMLMLRSERPDAEKFQDWIVEEVIPAIRKHGCYALPMTRLAKLARKNKCSLETALARGKNIDANKAVHSCLARYKAKRPHYRAVHNRLAEAQFGEGWDVPAQRKEVGLRSWQTPLDHYEEIPLTINNLIKQVGLRALQDAADAGTPVPLDEIADFLAARGRECAQANLRLFGEGSAFGSRKDEVRGKVFDVVRPQIGGSN